MSNSKLSKLEEKFCLVYACGPAPYNGNAKRAFDLVFNDCTGNLIDPGPSDIKRDVEVTLSANELMRRDDIRDRIDQLQAENIVNASTLRPRLTEQLLKIVDECSTLTCEDKFGTKLSPAALRSVAVNAAGKIVDMYGIKEDIAHKVMLEGSDGDGITFNLIVPESNKENEAEFIGE